MKCNSLLVAAVGFQERSSKPVVPKLWYVKIYMVVRENVCCLFSLPKQYIHSYSFYLTGSDFLSFCALCWCLKMANIISHSHFVDDAFVSSLVSQTFDRMIAGWLIEISWSNVAHGDSTRPTNGTRSQNVREPYCSKRSKSECG